MKATGLWEPELVSHKCLKEQYINCDRCPLHRRRTRVVFWDGPDKSPLMAVAEAPGRDEDKQGRPFAGRAGRDSLDPMLRFLGVNRNRIHITNACLCRPTDGHKNLTPSWEEIRTCNSRLLAEIRLTEPEVIVTMGKPAAVAVFGANTSSSMTSLRGWHEMTYTKDGVPYTVPVMGTWHPAYELRATQAGNHSVRKQMTDDWRQALAKIPQIKVDH